MSKDKSNKPKPKLSSIAQNLKAKLSKVQKVDDPQIGKNYETNGHAPKMGSFREARKVISATKFLIPGWVPYGYLTVIFADSGVGKSAFVLHQIVNTVLTGSNWFNGAKGPKPGPVLWCDTEASTGLNLLRIDDWALKADEVLTLFENPLDTLDLDNEDHMNHLEECIVYYKIKLVIVDTLRGAHRGEENSSRIANILRNLANIAERTGAAIILTHHTNKLPPDVEMSINNCRGSTAIAAQARCVIGLDKPDRGSHWVRMRMLKQNFGLYPDPIGFLVGSEGIEIGPAPEFRHRQTEKDKAVKWLLNRVKPGKVYKASLLIEEAEQEGFSKFTILKARKDTGIKAEQVRKDGKVTGWKWFL